MIYDDDDDDEPFVKTVLKTNFDKEGKPVQKKSPAREVICAEFFSLATWVCWRLLVAMRNLKNRLCDVLCLFAKQVDRKIR
jgi:hypothetical protein